MSPVQQKARRRLIVALVILFVASSGIAGVWVIRKNQIRSQYAEFKRQGLQDAQSGDTQAALDMLGKYIRRYPTDVEALIAYADARQRIELPRQGHLVEAMRILRTVLLIEPNHPIQRHQVLELYTKLGFTTEALATAELILQQNPSDPAALRCKTTCQLRLRDEVTARHTCELWVVAEPASLDARLLMLWLIYDTDKKADGAVSAAETWAAAHPKDPEFETLLGSAYLLANNVDKATISLKAAASRNPQDTPLILALVDKLDRIALLDDSLALLARSASSTGNQTIRLMLMRRYWQAGQYPELLKLLDKGLSDDPDQRLEQLAIKAASLRKLNRNAEAQTVLAQIDPSAGPVAAAWAMMPGYIAGSSVDELSSRKMRDAALAALQIAPDSPYLRQCLAEADLQLGEIELAVTIYRELVSQHPAWLGPQARLSDLLLSRGRIEEAMDVAYIGLNRSKARSVGLAGTLARAWDAAIQHGLRSDKDQLFQLVAEIQGNTPGEERSLPIYVRLLIEKGDNDKAAAALRNALDSDAVPSEQSLIAWAGLSRANKMGLEDACLARLEKQYGVTPTAAFNRAYGLFAAGKLPEGAQLLEDLRSRAHPDAKQLVLWKLAAVRYMDLINSPDATSAWIKLADESPNQLLVQEGALSSPSTEHERDFLSRAIDRVRTLTGDVGQTWKLARARWYLLGPFTQPDADHAFGLLQDVLRGSPDSIEARFLLAQCYDKQNNIPQAVETLLTASRLEPGSRPIALFLAELLTSTGDYTRARQQLDRLTTMKLSDPEQIRRTAILLAQQGDASGAAQLIEAGQAQSREEELLLANLYYHLHQIDRAKLLSDKLLANPDVAAITLAANLYAAVGEVVKARGVLTQLDALDRLAPVDRDIILADFESRYGDKLVALDLLQKATVAAAATTNPATNPTTNPAADATANAANPAAKHALAWRELIAGLLQQRRTDEALADIDLAVRANPTDGPLLAIQAHKPVILTAMNNGLAPLAVGLIRSSDTQPLVETIATLTNADAVQPSRALAQLQQLADRYPSSLPVQLVVAERCLQMNRFDRAISIAGRATQAFPQAPEPARLGFAAMLRPKKEDTSWPAALGMAKLWKERATDDTEDAQCAIAACYEQLGQYDDALHELQSYTHTAADPDKHGNAVISYSLLLYRLHRAPEAEQVLLPLLSHRPIFPRWAAVIARTLPPEFTSKAIDQLTSAADPSPEFQIILAQTIDSAAQRTGDASHVPAANAICQALEARPDKQLTPDILAALAARHAAADWQAAAKLYRRAIALGDHTGGSLNNLAVLLSQNGKPDEALTLSKHAVELFPAVPNFFDTLADIQRTQGKFTDAVASERRAVALQPMEAKWRITLAELLLAAGLKPEAKTAFDDWNDLRAPALDADSPLGQRVARLQARFAKPAAPGPGSSNADSLGGRAASQ